MKRLKNYFKAVLVMFTVVAGISVCNCTFAQEVSISGAVKDVSTIQDTQKVNLTATDVNIGILAGAGNSDASGNYPDSFPSLRNNNLAASRLEYIKGTTRDVIKFSEMTPNRADNISDSGNEAITEKPAQTTLSLASEMKADKSYLIPAVEIPAFIVLLNLYDRHASPDSVEPSGKKTYSTNLSTFWDHVVHGPWVVDEDSFAMNQFGHPYQGSMYYGFARSAGLNYWESLVYTNVGSFLWETGGETSNPSVNDSIASGIGGTFFGEALFRMADRLLDNEDGRPGFWHQLAATILSPPSGVNRLAFGARYKSAFPSQDPAVFWRLRLGINTNTNVNDPGMINISRHETTADYSIAYGLPGEPGYAYGRPFDYFHFEFTTIGNAKNPFDNIMIRGFLLGKDYDAGDSYRGIWGLYGGYDYISPHVFRISSTSASLGTTFQWWLARAVALQGSALGGVGYAAAGNVRQVGLRDYHYGVAPQGLLALRLILYERAMLDLTGRAYYLSGLGGSDPGGTETIDRLNAGLTVRVYKNHALGIQYIWSIRDARYPDRPDSHQKTGTISLVYTLIGDSRFGAVEWRDTDRR
jgi:hypothetical protein